MLAGDGKTKMKDIIIGVLALQGDFREHIDVLKKLDIKTQEIRLASKIG